MLNHALLRALAFISIRSPRLRHGESGQTLAEYSLIITVVAVGLVLLAMMVFRTALAAAFGDATRCLDGVC
jgi:Flp pilus assembly pilin Flp